MCITTDASELGYGAVLEQNFKHSDDEADEVRPIEYFSKNYTSAQKKYSTSEKELLAIVMAVEHFHPYVYGKRFIINTDHLPLTWLWNKAQPHPRLERWMMRLALYEFTVKFKPGRENIVADFLSRPEDAALNDDDERDDYHDQLVANIETRDSITKQTVRSTNESDEEAKNICVIAAVPDSEIVEAYKSYKDEQEKDDDINWIKEIILEYGDERPTIKQFENRTQRLLYKEYDHIRIVEDVAYRICEDKDGFVTTQFILPAHITKQVIRQIHSSVYNAHLGRKKTAQRIVSRMYRPDLKDDIRRIIQTCDICQKIKRAQPTHIAEMMYLTPYKPNQLVTTDLAGPFKITERGNRNFLVMIDHFTKYIQVIALPDITAETVANRIVNDWCCKFGIPDSILADGGTQYQSKLLDLVYTYLDIKPLRTTPGHPACNGQSEVTVKTTKGMIRAYIDEDQETWDLNLEKYAFAYNTAVHSSTRQTPFEMMFGRKPKIPIDIVLPNTELHDREPIIKEFKTIDNEFGSVTVLEDHPDLPGPIIPALAEKYLQDLRIRMEHSYRIASKHRDSAMEISKLYHDRKIKKFTYEVGDYVLVDHPHLKKGLSRGIAHKYYGPFVIKKRKDNNVDYYIQRAGKNKGKLYQLHQNRLKAYEMHEDGLERQDDSSDSEAEPKRKRQYKKNLDNPRWKQGPSNKTSSESESSSDESEKQDLNRRTRANRATRSSHSESSIDTDGAETDKQSLKNNPGLGLYNQAGRKAPAIQLPKKKGRPSKAIPIVGYTETEVSGSDRNKQSRKNNPGLGSYSPARDGNPAPHLPEKRSEQSKTAKATVPSNEAKTRLSRVRKPPDRLLL